MIRKAVIAMPLMALAACTSAAPRATTAQSAAPAAQSAANTTQSAAATAQSAATTAQSAPAATFGMVIHGGAGTIQRGSMTPEREAEYRAALEASLRAGHRILAAGGSSLDAVEAAVHVMEDSPLFNSARGAVFTSEGRNELDAAIMDGSTLRAGAVAGVTHTKNPVTLARRVMENSPHCAAHSKPRASRCHRVRQAYRPHRNVAATFRTMSTTVTASSARSAQVHSIRTATSPLQHRPAA